MEQERNRRIQKTKYAKPSEVENILRWAKQSCGKSPELVNPPGLNCVNGVLEISWVEETPKWCLVPHNPGKHFYLYEPQVEYNPSADPEACTRLLECLDPSQRDIFLKSIAASLDLFTVRKRKGRMVSDLAKLDKLQSLKMAITGEQIDIESKGKDEFSIEPKCIFLFNINDTPDLKAALEAIESRYAILNFTKVYKESPNLNLGELKADSRFKYDPEFIRKEVLPAFLNRLLKALEKLMKEGIDYSCTKDALNEVRQQSNHLYQFCEDVGIEQLPNSKMYAKEIWKLLEEWYIENGTLTIDKSGKHLSWNEQVNSKDKNVKACNQVIKRLLEIFPKAQKGKKDEKGCFIMGIGLIKNNHLITESTEAVEANLEAVEIPEGLPNTTFEAPEAVKAIFSERNLLDTITVKHTHEKSFNNTPKLLQLRQSQGEARVTGVNNSLTLVHLPSVDSTQSTKKTATQNTFNHLSFEAQAEVALLLNKPEKKEHQYILDAVRIKNYNEIVLKKCIQENFGR